MARSTPPIASHFAPGNVQNLLKSIQGAASASAEFEAIANAGLLGQAIPAAWRSSATPTRARSASSTSPPSKK